MRNSGATFLGLSFLFLIVGCTTVNPKEDVCYAEPLELSYDYLADMPFFTDMESAIACAKQNNKPIFILFTGHACVAVRDMPYRIFKSDSIRKVLNEHFVSVALFVDDREKLLPSEIDSVVIDGHSRVFKTVGQRHTVFQLGHFRSNAQPLYVCVDHDYHEMCRMDFNAAQGPDVFLEKLLKAKADFLQ